MRRGDILHRVARGGLITEAKSSPKRDESGSHGKIGRRPFQAAASGKALREVVPGEFNSEVARQKAAGNKAREKMMGVRKGYRTLWGISRTLALPQENY